MTNKKLIVKIAKVLRKYFDLSFVDSLTIGKAIVRDFNTPESFLNKDEEHMITVLHQLTEIEYDKPFALSIESAIDANVVNSKWSEETEGYIITYDITNRKTGTVTDITIEC